ncbi:MAG: tRNA pseudouridine(13) synthase TruD [Planctomycetota bacterium]|nr:tRNA pseudouridine(13) synthase TruD [Planctomycetota bacterium]
MNSSLRNPSDFFVEEVPLYEPSGSGDHCLFWIEKSGISTPEAIRRLARALGRRDADFGYAGLKDAASTSRQAISLKDLTPAVALSLDVSGLKVLRADMHSNKVRVGHLAGNRFRIRIGKRTDLERKELTERLEQLQRDGLPNTYGVQRFGQGGANPILGKAILQADWDRFVAILLGEGTDADSPRTADAREAARGGDYGRAHTAFPPSLVPERAASKALARGADPQIAVRAIPRRFRQFYLSALQSLLFNRLLELRLPQVNDPLEGDLAYLHRNGACFVIQDPGAERPRIESFEISISGPIYGYKMKWPEGKAREMEEQVLSDEHLEAEGFRIGGGLSQKGSRRSLRAPVEEAALFEEGGEWHLRFRLPKGSYATSLLEALGLPAG